jgi:CHAD domain-containing protein
MGFHLTLSLPLADNIRAAGAGQLRIAHQSLQLDGGDAQDVHSARKAIKRFRSLLRLIQPAIAKRDFQRFDESIGKAGRAFASVRDIHVMIETVTRLSTLRKGTAYKRAITALGSRLRLKREQAETNRHDTHVRQAVAGLEALRHDFEKVTLNIRTFSDIESGLVRTYRRGARAMAQALKSGSDEDHHDWRKAVQRHWRHLQFLSPIWPAMLTPQIKLARDLAEALGKDHDLATLRRVIARDRQLAGRGAGIATVVEVCTREQAALRQQAVHMGKRLFAESPKALGRRFAAYWEMAGKDSVPAEVTAPAPEPEPIKVHTAAPGNKPGKPGLHVVH